MELPTDIRERLSERDPEALGLLFDVFFQPIWRYLCRASRDQHVAEDLSQEVFLRAYRLAAGYDPARPVRPWLFKIATNVLHDHWQKLERARSREPDLEERETHLDRDPESPSVDMERAELKAVLDREIGRLSETARVVVLLRIDQELEFPEIARILDIEVAAARKRYSRAMEALRESLQGRPE